MLRTFYRALLDLVFPITCVGCGADGVHLCDLCIKKIPDAGPAPMGIATPGLQIISAKKGDRNGRILRRLIHRFKYDGIEEISEIICRLVSDGICVQIPASAILIPVPLHPRRKRLRGFNQSETIAKNLAQRRNIPMKNLLVRTRYTRPQAELSREDRIKNVYDAFILREAYETLDPSLTYCIVDDVFTTGSTMEACAAVLRKAGATRILGFVIVRGL